MRCSALALFLLLAACAGKPPAPVTVHTLFHECPRPDAPAFFRLDREEHIGSPANVARLMDSIDIQLSFILALESALDCYERQSRGAE